MTSIATLDLTTVKDHPATILAEMADALPETHIHRSGFAKAAEALRNYEGSAGVIFAALEVNALEGLTEAVQSAGDKTLTERERLVALLSTIQDLLGIEAP